MTVPSTTEPMLLWIKTLPVGAAIHPRAHLEPSCPAITTRVGAPSSVIATHLRDRSYLAPANGRPRWSRAVRVDGHRPRLREHLDVLVCAHCLDRAFAAGLVGAPPPLRDVFPRG